MMNLYTYNPFTGIVLGMQVELHGMNPRNQRSLPPHVSCGAMFVGLDTSLPAPPIKDGLINSGSLRLVEPMNSNVCFHTLVQLYQGEKNVFVQFNQRQPHNIRLHYNPETINAWWMGEANHGAQVIVGDRRAGEYFVEFPRDGAEFVVWYINGHISRVVRRGDTVVEMPFTPIEIARMRIDQVLDSLAEMSVSDVSRRNGVMNAILRLLSVTSDQGAFDEYVDFLVDQRQGMSGGLAAAVRAELLRHHHPFAGHFIEGWSTNVVSIKRGPKPRRDNDRSEEDRRLRNQMRGSNGQKQQTSRKK